MQASETATIDVALGALSASADRWVGLSIESKILLLHEVADLLRLHAEEWVYAGMIGKRIPPGTPLEGEEWISGPYPLVTWIEDCIKTLTALAAGEDPLSRIKRWTRDNGQVVARVYPTTPYESLLLSGYRLDVWMDPDVAVEDLSSTIGTAHNEPGREGRVALVLGAGNISSIPPLDILNKLFMDLEVVAVKLNPVNQDLGPVFEKIFAPFIRAGFVRFLYGAADVGAYLTGHTLVDTVHITGAARTHDAIVFGSGQDGERRRREGRPLLAKPITSELGGVSPTIVVPGPWTSANIKFQAEHIITQKLHNSGFNCIASQVLVLPSGWSQGEELVAELARLMDRVQDRMAYYPMSDQRQQAAVANHPEASSFGVEGRRVLISNVDPASAAYCFAEEFFGPTYATTSLPARSASEFLESAVAFCNERLYGDLGANIIIHPDTARELGPRLERAVDNLRYGAVGVNVWTGLAYLVTRAPWGAAPGHTLSDVGSGIGFKHNAMLFGRPQKAVAWGPFHNLPRNLASGEFHISPRPPWFVTNRTGHTTSRRLTEFVMDRRLSRLPGIFAAALRG